MFKGFNVKYPEYEVILPQTHLSFTVRSMNVQEEERLKGSLVTPSKITEHLNKCLYDAIVNKPEIITDYRSFLENVSMKDRDALLYGLYHITYEEVRNYNVTCGSCGKEYPVTVKVSDIFNFKEYPGNDIFEKREIIELPLTTGVTAVIKQPKLSDELEIINRLGSIVSSNLDAISEVLIIDSFRQDITEQKEPVIYNDQQDVLDAYLTLPAKDKRDIHTRYREVFGQYGIELKMRSNCKYCGYEENIDIDLVTNFFRQVYSA